ncbi:hypothetical protein [Pseudoxanthomonas dokdonensis]|uniref:Uncharacterized protein n=1 Tax=Pseudoxanthomonas dokdonensis TaxID=344882 RepID=A0A0R0CSB8_9GAMM|nr:hypothetical protein [Pseudoxanthomonas dokdonensis]KRG68798.1 hypothetical protein ABB29_09910 [Pseudoxanthomonas dokdonensis]
MSNAIRFLETLGQNPTLAALPANEIEALMATMALADDQRRALLAADAGALNQALNGRQLMMAIQHGGNEEDENAPMESPVRQDDDEEE